MFDLDKIGRLFELDKIGRLFELDKIVRDNNGHIRLLALAQLSEGAEADAERHHTSSMTATFSPATDAPMYSVLPGARGRPFERASAMVCAVVTVALIVTHTRLVLAGSTEMRQVSPTLAVSAVTRVVAGLVFSSPTPSTADFVMGIDEPPSWMAPAVTFVMCVLLVMVDLELSLAFREQQDHLPVSLVGVLEVQALKGRDLPQSRKLDSWVEGVFRTMGHGFESCDREGPLFEAGDLADLAQVGVGQAQEVPAFHLADRPDDALGAAQGRVAPAGDEGPAEDGEELGFEVQQSFWFGEEGEEVWGLEPVQDRVVRVDADLQRRVAVEEGEIWVVPERVVCRQREFAVEQVGLGADALVLGLVEALAEDEELALRKDRSSCAVAQTEEPLGEVFRVVRV
ncbi:MAG: hypothetical protein H7062_22345 [Candidatus Saccharimonas sp.]|nr:hypothetical protein [Planctomycetaceae bacterium]